MTSEPSSLREVEGDFEMGRAGRGCAHWHGTSAVRDRNPNLLGCGGSTSSFHFLQLRVADTHTLHSAGGLAVVNAATLCVGVSLLPSAQIFLLSQEYSFYVEKAAALCGIDEGSEPLLSNARAICGLESVEEKK